MLVLGKRESSFSWRQVAAGGTGEGGTGSANSRDMSRLLDVMTTVEMDDDDLPLILINHLGMQRWLARGVGGAREGVAIYNLNARRAGQSGTRTVLYLMLPSIAIVELLKLIPPPSPPPPPPPSARRSGSIEVNYSLDSARDETSSSLRVGLLRPIKKSRKRALSP